MPGAGSAPLTGCVAHNCSLASMWPIQICVLGNDLIMGTFQVIYWRPLFLNIQLANANTLLCYSSDEVLRSTRASLCSSSFSFFIFWTENGIKGLMHAEKALYCGTMLPNPLHFCLISMSLPCLQQHHIPASASTFHAVPPLFADADFPSRLFSPQGNVTSCLGAQSSA